MMKKTTKGSPGKLVMAVVLGMGGLCFAWHSWHSKGILRQTQTSNPQPPEEHNNTNQVLLPPHPNLKFENFTPEDRVKFAGQGQGPGG